MALVYLVSNKDLEKISLSDALFEASKMMLDLVQVSERDNIPVVKIMDYSKMQYEESKKIKKNKKVNKTEVKEIRMSYSIQDNDLNIKVKNIDRMLEKESYKVKVQVILRGRERAYSNLAKEKLEYVLRKLNTSCFCKDGIKCEGNSVYMILEPAKDK